MSDQVERAPSSSVLTLDAVSWGIRELKKPEIHRHFFAYLYLCRQAAILGREDIQPNWKYDFGNYIELITSRADIVQEKPYYLPIANQNVRDQSTYWLNDNLAGSYAPSSVREAALRFLLDGKRFYLPRGHAQLALDSLLGGTPIPPAPVAAYLLRNFAFVGDVSTSRDLTLTFADAFGFDALDDGAEAFSILFDPASFPNGLTPEQADSIDFDWFEPLHVYETRAEGRKSVG